MKKFLVIIPARYQSKRLPGKPLIKLNGIPMIVRTARQAEKAVGIENVCIATDDIKIKKVVESFGFNCVLTSEYCKTGTDRVAEASTLFKNIDFFINLQGDEPIVDPENIKKIINFKIENPDSVVTSVSKIYKKEDFFNKNIVKMVFSKNKKLLYASRSSIPITKTGDFLFSYKHLPIYAFSKSELNQFVEAGISGKTELEYVEDVEILRFLEIDIPVKVIILKDTSLSVDVVDDVKKINKFLKLNEKK